MYIGIRSLVRQLDAPTAVNINEVCMISLSFPLNLSGEPLQNIYSTSNSKTLLKT